MAGWDSTIDKFEPAHFGIPKKAIRQWAALNDAMDKHLAWPCLNNPFYYADYEGYHLDPLTVDDCEALCADCPLLKQCYDFAVASDQEHGIWGGISFYKNLVTIDDELIDIGEGNKPDPNAIF